MNSLKIVAKSGQGEKNPVSLFEHTRDVLTIFDKFKHCIPAKLHDFIRLAIISHDWGKVIPAFQIKTMKNKNYKPSSPLIAIPHSLVSIIFINEQKLHNMLSDMVKKQSDSEDEATIEDYFNFILSAIAFHHWRENFFELISSSGNELTELCEELERLKKTGYLENNLREEIKKLGHGWHELIEFNFEMSKGLKNGVPYYEYVRPPYQLYFLPKRTEISEKKLKDWILISGFLQRADHFASFCEEKGENVNVSEPDIQPIAFSAAKERVIKKIIGKLANNEPIKIWQLEKIDDYKNKNLILITPTGYGKTEFAFLWGSGEKFLYTLPLRAAVNDIYKRASDLIGEDKTGILHSDADIYLLGDGGENQTNMKAYDLARQLAYPSIISTGDQFFPYALRPPNYEKIYASLSYSRLIIDEVQAYDPRASAIIVKFIEDVAKMGGKFLLMTATLPEFVCRALKETLKDSEFEIINLYEEKKKDLEKIKKHKIRVDLIENDINEKANGFSLPADTLDQIIQAAIDGKRVMVIANTVKQAVYIFEHLKKRAEDVKLYSKLKDKFFLLHSQFTLQDKDQKISELMKRFGTFRNDDENAGRILIATQVVEASLDIDADVLFTEIAPMDNLVQRMGRVLRRYGPMISPENVPEPVEPNIFIWVFQKEVESGRGYVYDRDLLLITLKLLRDKSLSKNNYSGEIREWLLQMKKRSKKNEDQISETLLKIFEEIQAAGSQRKKRLKIQKINEYKSFEILCSEYDKYCLVKSLYGELPDNSKYLKKFEKTREILDAGYMSDRKEEAHRLFREICTITVIPTAKKDELKENIIKFLSDSSDNSLTYTVFKKEILSKFIIQIPWKSGKSLLEPVDKWLSLQEINESDRKKVKRWCQGIYFAECEYNSEKGILRSGSGENDFIY